MITAYLSRVNTSKPLILGCFTYIHLSCILFMSILQWIWLRPLSMPHSSNGSSSWKFYVNSYLSRISIFCQFFCEFLKQSSRNLNTWTIKDARHSKAYPSRWHLHRLCLFWPAHGEEDWGLTILYYACTISTWKHLSSSGELINFIISDLKSAGVPSLS